MASQGVKRDDFGPGFWLETANQAACEIAAMVGYRLIILDMEHGVLSVESADRLVPFCKGLGLTVFARVAVADRLPIQQALDAGVDGIIVPQLQSARHAREAMAFAKYPPLGTRGMGYGRTTGYVATRPGFADAENRRLRSYAMIETAGGLAEVETIAALETVDGLFLGPADLSLTSGRGVYQATPEDLADARRIARAAHAAGKPWAMPALTPEAVRFAADHGAAYITVSDDRSALRIGSLQGLALAKDGG